MLNKETKRRIDKARDILVGQLPLPSDQIELITIALIYKFMDDIDEQSRELGGKPTFFVGDLRDLSWRKLISNTLSADERVTKFIQGIEAVSDAKNQSIPELFKSIFKNAFLKFRDGQVLKLFLDEINGFNYDHSEELGNAFEYLLDTMGTQGQNGQFRTPRNIIEFIVDVVDPQKDETILDPACGTAGFLISAYKHIVAANTSAKAAEKDAHAGDQLKGSQRDKLTRNITGYDITPLMCRLSRVNMYLHHFANPVIHEYDTLTNKNRWGDKFDVILANPPFMTPTGGVSTHDKFRIAAKRAEVLFADFILEHLNANGRAGFIVPEGIIFQNNDDYVSLRKWLINEAGIWAVVSLPANIFQPYSGVKTSVLLVDRALARQRGDVLLVKVENDGFSLNTNRTPIPQNDLPAALELLKVAKQPEYQSAIAKLETAIQHQLVPRDDFAKLDAYKAGSSAYDFCRKFFVRAERLKKTAAESRASGDEAEAVKAEKSLAKVREEFTGDTGLGKLPATEAELKTRFDEQLKEAAVAYGNLQPAAALAGALKQHLDNQREYSLTLEKHTEGEKIRSAYPTFRVEQCLADFKYPAKILAKSFLPRGKFPIVDQSETFIAGYWNDESCVARLDRPVVIFGDHTLVFKYVDFDFCLGADGVKVLRPIDDLDPKFFLLHSPLASYSIAWLQPSFQNFEGHGNSHSAAGGAADDCGGAGKLSARGRWLRRRPRPLPPQLHRQPRLADDSTWRSLQHQIRRHARPFRTGLLGRRNSVGDDNLD